MLYHEQIVNCRLVIIQVIEYLSLAYSTLNAVDVDRCFHIITVRLLCAVPDRIWTTKLEALDMCEHLWIYLLTREQH